MQNDQAKVLSGHIYSLAESILSNLAGNILEIGAFNGAGTARLARAFPDRIVYSIDPFIEDGYTVGSSYQTTGDKMMTQKENFAANTQGLTNIVHFETTSKEFLEVCSEEMVKDMNIRLIIIDGSHHYEDVAVDGDLAIKLLEGNEGVILFDDMEHIGVRRAYHEFMFKHAERTRWNSEYVIENGIGRAVKLEKL